MTLGTCGTTVIALIIMALPAWGQQQYLLYSPQPVTSSQPPPVEAGVLVQEIVIQRGDTLSALSRKFSGRGMYFPQILLFNSIKDPDLIYAGDTLRVPLTTDRIKTKPTGAPKKQKKAGSKRTSLSAASAAPDQKSTEPATASSPATELSLTELKPGGTKKSRGSKKKAGAQAQKAKQHDSSTEIIAPVQEPVSRKTSDSPAPTADAIAGQKLFEAAAKAYRLDDCKTALELLDLYLTDNSSSPLAADANLYKADCYLKLSAQ